MEYAMYDFTDDIAIPAKVSINGHTSPVWLQGEWKNGEYAEFVRKNGCGHCCTAMALNLHGITIDPHEEFSHCRKIWGEPRREEPFNEGNFMSVSGICKVLDSFGISAECYGVPEGETEKTGLHIENALLEGKQVILWSHPTEKLEPNPFSRGNHYVLAVGFTKDGKVLVANSSRLGETKNGIQFTDIPTICAVLYEGSSPLDYTWGRKNIEKNHIHNSGYVIVE
ncbi:MAG: C39 family peptidase [Clostridia bacterium]|nr:C39 family peptidase [Clostridia bacterium]